MREYIRNITKTNDLILNGTIENDEIDRFSKADYRWADNKRKNFQTRIIKKGEIYQFEFGKNFVPEMSYEHRGLVIGVNKKLLYVLPIFSYDPQKHPDVYHPVVHIPLELHADSDCICMTVSDGTACLSDLNCIYF